MMTPQDVANCTFAKATIGGYNMASVDDFLDKLTEDYSVLYQENAALKAKLKLLADKVAEYREIEDTMKSTLLTAQKTADSLVAEAEKKRDSIINEASGGAKERVAQIKELLAAQEQRLVDKRAQVDAAIEAEDQRLAEGQKQLRAFIQSVEAVCRQELKLLSQLPELPAAPPPPPKAAAPAVEAEDKDKAIDQVIAAFSDGEKESRSAADADSAIAVLSTKSKVTDLPPLPDPAEDPFEEDDLPGTDPFAGNFMEDDQDTKVVKLDDLQFGRNYKKL